MLMLTLMFVLGDSLISCCLHPRRRILFLTTACTVLSETHAVVYHTLSLEVHLIWKEQGKDCISMMLMPIHFATI